MEVINQVLNLLGQDTQTGARSQALVILTEIFCGWFCDRERERASCE